MNMKVGNTSKKRQIYLVSYESVPSKIKIDYCLARGDERKFVKDKKGLPNEECIMQSKPFSSHTVSVEIPPALYIFILAKHPSNPFEAFIL